MILSVEKERWGAGGKTGGTLLAQQTHGGWKDDASLCMGNGKGRVFTCRGAARVLGRQAHIA